MEFQKIGVNIGKEVIAWASSYGKNLLASRPVKINTQDLKYVPEFIEDCVNFSAEALKKLRAEKNIFSKLEADLINLLKSGKVEDVRVIDKNGVLAENLKFIGDKYSVRLSPEQLFDEKIMGIFEDSTYIHNHPLNAPLSSNDIFNMAVQKIKKMIACTSDGGYSIMERKATLSGMNYNKFIDGAAKLVSEEIRQMKSLGKIRGITDIQRMELLNKWRYKRFGDFAGEFGLVFKSKINALNESSLEGNLFSVNPLQRFIDNVIIKYNKLKH
ncbi:MAG: hypothetical protein VZR09_05915 [Candidatus Gastranaerophilaceae bacterium]|nr:hypothetical protein [Candidatus Gastranaerophilaceae bacterium]